MQLWRWSWILIVAACAMPPAKRVDAVDSPTSLQQCLPPGGFAAVEVVNLAEVLDRVRESDGYRQWLESPVYQGWSARPEGRQALAGMKYVEDAWGDNLWSFAKSIVGQRCAIGWYPPAGMQPADYVVLLETAEPATVMRLREKLKPLVSAPGERVTPSDRTDGGWQLQHADGYAIVFLDRWIVISNNLSLLEMTTSRCQRPDGPSLADESARQRTIDNLGSDQVVVGWLDLEWLKQDRGVARFTPAKSDQPLLSLLWGGMIELAERAPSGGFALDAGTNEIQLTVSLSQPDTPLSESHAGYVPTPSSAGRIDLPSELLRMDFDRDLSLWYAARRSLLTAETVTACDRFETMFRALLQGKDFVTDVLPALGTQWTLVAAPQSFAHLPNRPTPVLPAFALVGEFRDAERGAELLKLLFETGITLANLQAAAQKKAVWNNSAETYHDVTLMVASRGTSAKPGTLSAEDNVMPVCAVVGDRFLIATAPDLARTLIDALHSDSKAAAEIRAEHFAFESSPSLLADLLQENRAAVLSELVKNGQWHWQGEREFDWLRDVARRIDPITFKTSVDPDQLRLQLSTRWR